MFSSTPDTLIRQLPPSYTNKERLKVDVKRLLGIVPGTWLSTLFGAHAAPEPRPWRLQAEISPCAMMGNCLALKLAGEVQVAYRERAVKVPLALWLPPEYPNGFVFACISWDRAAVKVIVFGGWVHHRAMVYHSRATQDSRVGQVKTNGQETTWNIYIQPLNCKAEVGMWTIVSAFFFHCAHHRRSDILSTPVAVIIADTLYCTWCP